MGVPPEGCDVLAAPLLVQTWHFRWALVCTDGQDHTVTATGKGKGVRRRTLLNLSIFCSSWSMFFLRLAVTVMGARDGSASWEL